MKRYLLDEQEEDLLYCFRLLPDEEKKKEAINEIKGMVCRLIDEYVAANRRKKFSIVE